jgi:hypothetical protein
MPTNERKRIGGVGGINSQPLILYHNPIILSISLVDKTVTDVVA